MLSPDKNDEQRRSILFEIRSTPRYVCVDSPEYFNLSHSIKLWQRDSTLRAVTSELSCEEAALFGKLVRSYLWQLRRHEANHSHGTTEIHPSFPRIPDLEWEEIRRWRRRTIIFFETFGVFFLSRTIKTWSLLQSTVRTIFRSAKLSEVFSSFYWLAKVKPRKNLLHWGMKIFLCKKYCSVWFIISQISIRIYHCHGDRCNIEHFNSSLGGLQIFHPPLIKTGNPSWTEWISSRIVHLR